MATAERACIPIALTGGVTRPLKTSEVIAREVVRAITSQGLQPGDGLPSEAVMLDQYGVSRESLREALRLLEVQGLISIRRGPGGGPIVGTVDPAHLGRVSTLYYHMAGATYRELFEAWMLAEVLLAERAARNPDAAARHAAMAPYLADANGRSGEAGDTAEFVLEHTGFHGRIASLGRNRVLELTLQSLAQIGSHHVAVMDDPRTVQEHIEHDHAELARAIAAGRPRVTRALMEEHIEHVSAPYAVNLGPKMDEFIEWL